MGHVRELLNPHDEIFCDGSLDVDYFSLLCEQRREIKSLKLEIDFLTKSNKALAQLVRKLTENAS